MLDFLSTLRKRICLKLYGNMHEPLIALMDREKDEICACNRHVLHSIYRDHLVLVACVDHRARDSWDCQ